MKSAQLVSAIQVYHLEADEPVSLAALCKDHGYSDPVKRGTYTVVSQMLYIGDTAANVEIGRRGNYVAVEIGLRDLDYSFNASDVLTAAFLKVERHLELIGITV